MSGLDNKAPFSKTHKVQVVAFDISGRTAGRLTANLKTEGGFMKNGIIAFIVTFTLIFSVPGAALAEDLTSGTSTKKMARMFEAQDMSRLKVACLSNEEMKETEGELLGFAAAVVISGAVGAWTHHYAHYRETGHLGSSTGAAYAAGTSMVTTALSSGISYGANLGRLGSTYFKARGMAQNYGLSKFNPDNY